MNSEEKVNKIKEIKDLQAERKKIIELLSLNKTKELNKYLYELAAKYFVERIYTGYCYNSDTVEKNAENCLVFLQNLEKQKDTELLKETVSDEE